MEVARNPYKEGNEAFYSGAEECPVVRDPHNQGSWSIPNDHPGQPDHSNPILSEFCKVYDPQLRDRTLAGVATLPHEVTDLHVGTRLVDGRLTRMKEEMASAAQAQIDTSPFLPSPELGVTAIGQLFDLTGQLSNLSQYLSEELPTYLEYLTRASESSGLQLMAEHTRDKVSTLFRQLEDQKKAKQDQASKIKELELRVAELESNNMRLAQCIHQHEMRAKGHSMDDNKLAENYKDLAAKCARLEEINTRLNSQLSQPESAFERFKLSLVERVDPENYRQAVDYLDALLNASSTPSVTPRQQRLTYRKR